MESIQTHRQGMVHVLIITFTSLVLSLAAPAGNMAVPTANNDTVQIEIVTKVLSASTAPSVELVPDIVVTLTVIGACAGIGIGIAKCADLVYDRHIAKFSKREISDNTRKLLRARMAIMRMKTDPKSSELKFAKKAASMWMSRTAGKKDIADSKSSSNTNEIGTTHVPGIQVDRLEGEQSKASSSQVKEETKIVELTVGQHFDQSALASLAPPQFKGKVPNKMNAKALMPPVVLPDLSE